MRKELTLHADSIEQAIAMACEQLQKGQEELKWDVIRDVKKSLFGKIKEQAEVTFYYEEQDVVEQPEVAETVTTTSVDEDTTKHKIEIATTYLKDVLSAMGLNDVHMDIDREEDNVKIVLEGDNMGVAIGRRGETLDALQYLVSLVANREEGDYVRFIIDSGNFREKREETLRHLAAKIAKTTLKTGRNSTLEPMNPYERRIIHSVVSEIEGVYSKSIGEEPNRKVVVISEHPRKSNRNGKGGNYHKKPRERRNYDDKDYVIPKDVSNQPSTYDFEKEFLKKSSDTKLYSKIEFDD
ncbi:MULTISPECIES: RNA-binding cell elongation regulator Jag/EloR [Clostridiaceae]|uniref:RNA-binding protein KhpB n=1 Tax=Clostridium facile TaxID=2763035 RepID=A0ABR7ISY7_9CLOT|nr:MULTISPECIES: RNA-binding cell elongation regulator Jag/EloR [Clostridiaceae]MBC5788250.1 KH domain-containing protein [Clostridium facile]